MATPPTTTGIPTLPPRSAWLRRQSHNTVLTLIDTAASAQPESAILAGVITPQSSNWEVEDALDELEQLADTAGAAVTDRVTQSLKKISASTYMGSGKVNELKALVAARNTDLVIFDDELSPVQIRNLEKALGCKLLDRSALILDIFARRAKTAIAKTQVELAQLEYLRTRLTRQWTHLSRQKGGIGTKGPGETQIETDRRLIGDRIATLKERLEKIDRQRQTQRKGRDMFVRLSLVGYTNAGKSTLMNALAGAGVLAENRLFATLDATTRQIAIDGNKQVLISDTVGFIRKLPHRLIESFKSTLDEVRESDVLLHVVDAAHPRFEDHIRVVEETLKEIEAGDKPTLLVFNKIDAIVDREVIGGLRARFKDAAFISAARGIGLSDLKERIVEMSEADFMERVAYLPVSESSAIAYLHRIGDVLSTEYTYARREGADEPEAVARLHFRCSRKHEQDVDPMLERYADLQPVAQEP